MPQHRTEVELTGIDGGNLLGFLAAMGSFRVLSRSAGESETVQMSWRAPSHSAAWVPVLHHFAGADDVIERLQARLCGPQAAENPAFGIGADLTLPFQEFREKAFQAASGAAAQRDFADFLAAFGSDLPDPRTGLMQDTAFRTMSGAGHQHFISFMRELALATDRHHLRRTLFEVWDYADGKPSMRWDPADYRPHALRAEDPSGDPIKTMRGANRLAVEALPCFPTMPRQGGLRTTAFSRNAEITWPLWLDPLDLETAESVVSLKDLTTDPVDRGKLASRGIAQVFRARRFTEGKYRNFSPARALL